MMLDDVPVTRVNYEPAEGSCPNAREKECNVCVPKFAKTGFRSAAMPLCIVPVTELLKLKGIARYSLNLGIRGICHLAISVRKSRGKGS